MLTYYRVEFPATGKAQHAPKRFRTEEQAKKYVKRVLGVADEPTLKSKANITAVEKTGTAI
jgi:hypothetical protein